MTTLARKARDASPLRQSLRRNAKNWELYLLVLIPLAYIIIFKYIPMYGAQIAFRDFQALKGITQSPWVGLKHFRSFFSNYIFWRLIKNTVGINLYSLVAGFPAPILLALCLNYVPSRRFKKTVQMITYTPHFISAVVMVGMLLQFLSSRDGLVNNLIAMLGANRVEFMAGPQYFWSVYVWSGIWQGMGYGSIIYIAALTSVDPELHEAAIVDGATILRRIRHIDLPSILPTVMILLILRCGQLFSVGFEKILLMQNDLNRSASEVIETYVYKVGISNSLGNFSYAAAAGLFTSVINFVVIIAVNYLSGKASGTSLW